MGWYENLREQREEVAYFMRRLYRQGLTSCSGGNISRRVEQSNQVLITPSTLDKGELQADQVGVVTLDGENLTPQLKPTIEKDLHLEILKCRPDVVAVAHAHPVYATTFSCMDTDIETSLTPETLMTILRLKKAPFHPAGTMELAKSTAEIMSQADVVIMRNHGVVTVGRTLLKAFDRLEVTEISAKMTWIAMMAGKNPAMTDEQKQGVVEWIAANS